jgi:undecaprenyl-diphosphatase
MKRTILGIVIAVFGLILAFFLDDTVTNWAAQPITSGQIRTTLTALRFFGEGGPIILLAFAGWLAAPAQRRMVILAVLCAISAGAIVDRIKLKTSRSRPSDTLPRSAADSWKADTSQSRNSSFPSGHTATAFAFARGLALAFPTITPAVVLAATGTAISRIHELRHYLFDCAVGGLFGWVFTGWVSWLGQRLGWISTRRSQPTTEHSFPVD